jgi:hypothetical protein
LVACDPDDIVPSVAPPGENTRGFQDLDRQSMTAACGVDYLG